jgi:hypothetical protein
MPGLGWTWAVLWILDLIAYEASQECIGVGSRVAERIEEITKA